MNRRLWTCVALILVCLRLLVALPAEVPGIRYEPRKTEGPQSIHILEVDPRLVRIEAVRALDDGVGRETVASIAQRKGALAAVNAGFFRIGGRYDGEPEGIIKIQQQWYSDPTVNGRGAIGWSKGGVAARIGNVSMKWQIRSRDKTYFVDGINRPRDPKESILYTWAFHRTTLTDPGGTEFLISRNKIIGITHQGNAGIPVDGFVFSVGPQSDVHVDEINLHAAVKIDSEISAEEDPGLPSWQAMDFIVGGMPALLRNHNFSFKPDSEKMRAGFAEERHPRTAVGLRADGSWVFVVVDGRQPGLSIGMDLRELSQLLLSLNCIDALNLDGGGSSTLYYQGKVVNSPSDAAKDRPVSDAIVILHKPRL
jgi:hypothetical protein